MNSWTQPPAYTQQPHHNPEPSYPPYGGLQSAGPLPQATATHAPGSDLYTPQAIEKREMLEPMICQSCDAGLVPGDIAYCCDACEAGVSTFCESCHRVGGKCYHEVAPAKLEAGEKLKNEDKDGDFGFGLKCDGCRAKLKDGAICWHCKRCFDPNFCADCWRRRDKRCKHAGQGKVQLRRVGKPSVSTDDILDGLNVVGSILGG
ncbi:hypothetical protein ISF_07023 [Cordyceps fumosorosea ARSEF 2679]|uniref:Uncharacterized protein n=1 Tax=Cordyceps fumosorosea (strain ARSEF 2679) TaxID=1081104 RepID=A0A167QMR7_CORFA|nr:hypothetical protein ISF_07023 [Cordyceps fumosorosea ARSEF 2679]OAA57782.1 hypothetical protein ISF_07023 [Cordyceps fumosorosea ARSEF 2679]